MVNEPDVPLDQRGSLHGAFLKVMHRINGYQPTTPETVCVELTDLYIKAGLKTFALYAALVKQSFGDIWDSIKNDLRMIWECAAVANPGIEEVSRADAARIIAEIDAVHKVRISRELLETQKLNSHPLNQAALKVLNNKGLALHGGIAYLLLLADYGLEEDNHGQPWEKLGEWRGLLAEYLPPCPLARQAKAIWVLETEFIMPQEVEAVPIMELAQRIVRKLEGAEQCGML